MRKILSNIHYEIFSTSQQLHSTLWRHLLSRLWCLQSHLLADVQNETTKTHRTLCVQTRNRTDWWIGPSQSYHHSWLVWLICEPTIDSLPAKHDNLDEMSAWMHSARRWCVVQHSWSAVVWYDFFLCPTNMVSWTSVWDWAHTLLCYEKEMIG